MSAAAAASSPPERTFALSGDQATATLLHVLYAGNGRWRDCNQASCAQINSDWGVDSATYALFLRWSVTHDPHIRTVMAELADTAPQYPLPCGGDARCSSWSDTPEWDAVTLMREYQVLGDPQVLARAKAAFDFVEGSRTFALGACPIIRYQLPQPSDIHVKTLETEANAIKAAILLYRATHDRTYLNTAAARYAAARDYFLDPQAELYSVHIVDDGEHCSQVPRRFFASVNGDMIWNGVALWHITRERRYFDEALATAKAVDDDLSDERGVFTDMQGENDVVEPLVEAMYHLAAQEHVKFARAWVLRNAAAALSARAADGTFARFFDGPAQTRTSVWQSNGGLALEIAAAALDPRGHVSDDRWSQGHYVGTPITALPATITLDGSGIALIGSLGENWIRAHVRVLIDGAETFDQTGLWENPSMHDGDSVFFAWRWKTAGMHTITLLPSAWVYAGAEDIRLETYVIP